MRKPTKRNSDFTPDPAADSIASPAPVVRDHVLLRKIGEGSYGEVWLARTLTGSYRAVKVVFRRSFTDSRPFDREFAGIQNYEPVSRGHEGLVDILHVGREESYGGYFYYVMELADNANGGLVDWTTYVPKTLESLLRPSCRTEDGEGGGRTALTVVDCIKIGISITAALGHLHRNGLVHRDVKPSNIIFVNGVPKLADIGLVAAANEECSFVGTLHYVPPEGPGKAQADLFAVGKVLYEMMTGLPVSEYPSLPADWAQSPAQHALIELNTVVMRACELSPKRRHASAEELCAELQLLLESGSVVLKRKLERIQRGFRLALLGSLGAVVLVTLGVGYLSSRKNAAEQARRRELREIQISRLKVRYAGWFDEGWQRLERAAAVHKDQELLEQATSLLTGWDARPVKFLQGESAGSAAFAPDGRALIGGVGRQGRTLLLDTMGVPTELPTQGEGPVGWTAEGVPVQLRAVTNGVVLLDVSTGTIRRECRIPGTDATTGRSPTVLAMTPDSSRLAAAHSGHVFVWDASTGELMGTIPNKATALAFSDDGSLVGAGSADGTTRVFQVPGLNEVAFLQTASRGNPIRCLALTRNRLVRYRSTLGTNSWLVATGDQGAGIVIWDLARQQHRITLRGSPWFVGAVAFHPDGQTLASEGRNDTRLWDLESGRLLLCFAGAAAGDSRALAFDGSGRRMIYSGTPGLGSSSIRLWELDPHRGIHTLRGLSCAARRVWFSAKGDRIAAVSDDWHLAIWDVVQDQLLYLFETPTGQFANNAGGCFDAEGNCFALAAGSEACLFDLTSGTVQQQWSLAEGTSNELQLDPRGRWRLLRREREAASDRWLWKLLELDMTGNVKNLHGQTETDWSAQDLFFAPGGEQFIVGNGGPEGTRKKVRAYDANSGRKVWETDKDGFLDDLRVGYEPNGRWFAYNAYTTRDRRILRSRDFVEIGKTPTFCDALSPSGHGFACMGQYFEYRDGKDFGFPFVQDYTVLAYVSAFSRDGRLFAWGTEDGVVLVADMAEVQRRLMRFR